MGSALRFLRPMRLIRRRVIRRGLLGGDRLWLGIGALIFLNDRIKSLFGFGEPKTVYVEELKPGERVVLAHEEKGGRRRRRS